MKEWTQKEIAEKLKTDVRWLEKGILAIYRYQTSEEQVLGETVEQNGYGFNGADASYLSYIARYLLTGRHLDGGYLIKSREKMIKYAGQLARIANGNQ